MKKKVSHIDTVVNQQSSIQVPKEKARWLDQYRNIYTQKMMPISVLYLESLALELADWAANTKEVIVEKFYTQKGIKPSLPRDRDWYGRCPELKEAFEFAKNCVGYRREEGALRNKLNVSMVMRTQSRYDKRWLSEERELATIKASASDKSDVSVKLKIVSDMVEGVAELEDKKEKND